MNAITISIVALVLTAALAGIAPASHFVQHEAAAFQAHQETVAQSQHHLSI
jgi:type II secretory pathway pseudopilin PulG